MKSKQSRLILFAVLAQLFLGAGVSHAWFWQEAPDKAVSVHYRLSVAAGVSTNTVIIDLSDTTNWPHKETGEINIDAIRIDTDKIAASSGTVKIGIVNMVNVTTGSVTWIWSREFSKNVSNTDVSRFSNNLPAYVKCRVNPASTADIDGSTPYILSSDKTSLSTVFQNDVNLPNPAATSAAPGAGDIILQVVNNDGTNAIVVTADLLYHSNSR